MVASGSKSKFLWKQTRGSPVTIQSITCPVWDTNLFVSGYYEHPIYLIVLQAALSSILCVYGGVSMYAERDNNMLGTQMCFYEYT